MEGAIVRAAEISGAKVRKEHHCITASFKEETLGFWLDILMTLEAVHGALQRAAPELYGHVCVLGRDIAAGEYETGEEGSEGGPVLLRQLPCEAGATGIWCSETVRTALEPYAFFEAPGENNEAYGQLKNFKALAAYDAGFAKLFPFSEQIQEALGQSDLASARRAVLLAPAFTGKREALSQYCRRLLGEFPPLVIRFGAGGTGLACITDALSLSIRSLFTRPRDAVPSPELPGKAGLLTELDSIGTFIFKERLGDEFSPFGVQKTRRFFQSLLENYAVAAKDRSIIPVILLENISQANPLAARLVVEVCNELFPPTDQGVYILGTCTGEAGFPEANANEANSGEASSDLGGEGSPGGKPSLGIWEALFSRMLRFSPSQETMPEVSEFSSPVDPRGLSPELPRDLWEIAYTMGLLRRYFPPALFLRLLEEEGKNPVMISRALDMLAALGIIDFTGDPLPRFRDFFTLAEEHLGPLKDRIHSLVRNRLLAWVGAGKLRPSFKLLEALADLGEIGSPELVLEALSLDLSNGTCLNLRRAIEQSHLEEVAGPDRLPTLLYIFKTQESLLRGDRAAIIAAFGDPPPEEDFPPYKVRILTNETSYSLSVHAIDQASELIKKAMLLCQGRSVGRGLAQAYRLFSLVNLSRRRLSDAMDYFAFAMEQAEKSEDFEEFTLSAYYAAQAQFLFGNIAKAERLARKAEETALIVGLTAWADRSRFLRGKLRFESGLYQDALDLFTELRSRPTGTLSPDAEDTLEAWIYRSAVYLGSAGIPKPARANGDARFFEIEASYLAGDYPLTAVLSERLLEDLPAWDFLFIEQPDWRSGFAQGELYLFSQREFLGPLIAAYHALALCRLDRPGEGPSPKAEARRSMDQLFQDEQFSDMDPNDAFYYYAYYCVLGESGAAEVDMNTAVSMAFKRLQRRASRIDDIEINKAFLNRHYWNQALCLEAKEHKLI
ncbi:hypothetical protein TREPR_3152 [Treponema primitia ZAS-2]|uniref:Tetratricopeptide repeat domain protein n=1 Tax=Treponema primitia (strain ATCC BAA-887 / DSM 12427 / ZAS-2) TaxID=545694 RepID=F5YLS7_TREPZ|nr:hypothetical protein TREPR_3152 [Treponema primitia ZAS-2]